MIDKAKSITHEHLLSIVNTESRRFPPGSFVRILDAGCGDGQLIAYLEKNLPILNQSLVFEVYGFDVCDHGVQQIGFLNKAIEKLSVQLPNIPWQDRVTCINTGDIWPYSKEFFDVIISNQVCEHVNNHDLFFSEIRRTLRWGGYSVHLFPLKHYINEGHLWLPFVHRIMNYDILRSYIKLLSRFGLGKFKYHKKAAGVDLNTYTERHADYIHFFTNYIGYKEALQLAKKHQLRISFRYTREFYIRKIRSILSLKKYYEYSNNRSSLIDWISLIILRYISSVTLFLEKKETYTQSNRLSE